MSSDSGNWRIDGAADPRHAGRGRFRTGGQTFRARVITRPVGRACTAVALALATAVLAGTPASAQLPPTPAVSDGEFWRLVTELSEPDGTFQPQLMSNEDSAQFVLPDLERTVAPGGIYLGVGSEQNFTYLAMLRPRLAFVLDIRRDNLLQMLMYKALFELAPTRTDFVSRLFSRPYLDPPAPDASVNDLFAVFRPVEADSALFDRTFSEMTGHITQAHGWPLTEADRMAIGRILEAFRAAGPFELRGYGDRNPSYAELMAATDLDGRAQSFLASEARYAAVRALQLENRIVPVVGDFAGDTALRAIGRELAARGGRVDVFYVSNVERYLWQEEGQSQRFYDNVSALPRDEASVFIRSLTTDISQRQSIPIPPGSARWRTLLFPIDLCLDGVANGRIGSYRDLFLPVQP